MTFGIEAVILVKIGLSSYRITRFSLSTNDATLGKQLDFIKGNREWVSIKLANYQQKFARGYNYNVKSREFVLRDLVLRRILGSMKEPCSRNLALSGEGPY